MDLKRAEAACRAAVLDNPQSPRAQYHLSRVLFYQGRVVESLPPLQQAADAGYRQAMFVLGFLHSDALPNKDYCRAAQLWTRAAALDHPWSAFHLVEKSIAGKLQRCESQLTRGDLDRFMRLAEASITVAGSSGRVERLRAQFGAYGWPTKDRDSP